MKKLEAFVGKHDKAILNGLAVIFLIPMVVLAVVDMDNIFAVVSLLGGYVVMAAAVLSISGADIRRSHRKAIAYNRTASEQNRKPV